MLDKDVVTRKTQFIAFYKETNSRLHIQNISVVHTCLAFPSRTVGELCVASRRDIKEIGTEQLPDTEKNPLSQPQAIPHVLIRPGGSQEPGRAARKSLRF
jgi:hypothetical protein